MFPYLSSSYVFGLIILCIGSDPLFTLHFFVSFLLSPYKSDAGLAVFSNTAVPFFLWRSAFAEVRSTLLEPCTIPIWIDKVRIHAKRTRGILESLMAAIVGLSVRGSSVDFVPELYIWLCF